ncbi:peptidyl-prolyl cis-trans isomerase C [Loktanella ponticola]|uniref:Parvulin-like PPIase n=1 Tax=Yoonia ponticola TaxID=1524255 RepID=A0A7W9BJA8_9RHOB|nr:peptidylprolyl isomerase [Yoonia ponticola]MBB5721366.1 peptidyl-prolyl cis-trans isomerase C [Yoonia ponticola]
MMKHATFLGSAALIAVLAAPVAAQDTTAATVIATVGETEITLGEMIIARAQLPQQYQALAADVLFDGVLEQLIQQQLLSDAVTETPDRVEYALRNERRSLLAGEAIDMLSVEAMTDEALQTAYDSKYETGESETEYNAAHLLVETLEEAEAAKARIDEGEEFADVAKEVSTGPSAPNGGNLGWFGAGQMVTPFEDAVMNMEVGAVSDPVETQFGFHVIKLLESRVKEAPELEEVRSELMAEVQEAAIQARLAELTEAADIVLPEDGAFDPELLGDLSLLEPK